MAADGPAPAAPPERLLVVAAHPGDADLAIGGIVAGWVAQGCLADLVCLTSGDASAADATSDPLEVAARREAGQRAAAEMLGYRAVTFLHRPEGALVNDLALREQLVRVIRATRPEAVAAPDPSVVFPSGGGVRHTDQREGGLAAADAVAPASRNPMAFPHLVTAEGLEPWAVRRLVLYWPAVPTAHVDVSLHLDRKLAALAAHGEGPVAAAIVGSRLDVERAGARIGAAAAEAFAVVELDRA